MGSLVGLRYGGMQPANTARADMFGKEAPMWPFLTRFGGPADPLEAVSGTRVFETYPVLVIIVLGWTLPDLRNAGRLPKYNPDGKNFLISDWKHVCGNASAAFLKRGLTGIAGWIDEADRNTSPRKRHQDCLDSCLCLLVALYFAEGRECLMVGDCQTGYIVVPHSARLHAELNARCKRTGRMPSEWVREFKIR